MKHFYVKSVTIEEIHYIQTIQAMTFSSAVNPPIRRMRDSYMQTCAAPPTVDKHHEAGVCIARRRVARC